MPNNTTTTLDAALKQYYAGGKLTHYAYTNHPLFALLPKSQKFPGKNIPLVSWYASSAGRSRTFATAQARASAEKTEDFLLTRKRDYAIAYIDMEALIASEDDAGSFLKLGTDVADGLNRTLTNNLAMSLYRNHGGARGKIGAISSGTLTLSNPGDIVNFEVGMFVRHASTDGTSGALEAEAAIEITGVDRQAGTITAAAWTGFDVGNWLFQEGDFGDAIYGLQSWIPTSVTPSENFLGVDRSVDSRLRGLYLNAGTAGYDHIEALEVLDAQIVREGGKPDLCLLNPLDLRVIRTQLGSQLEYDNAAAKDIASVSFKTLVMPSSGSGVIKLLGDPDCPQGESFLLQTNSWEFKSAGPAPRALESHGFKFITSEAEDSVQLRIGYYGNLACFAPSHNGRVTFAT
jgi:hypothetical protein